ncbi:MAG TPA: NADH-ubiquinone oxidoreductase-F iron-sulfur binding region domain-containing protein [Jatrophihabitans sp.]|jgi:NADH:ubiquinone oxidoreductase subunit F (NADH-binding)
MIGLSEHPAATRPSTIGSIGRPRLVRGIGAADLTAYAAHLAVHGPLPQPGRAELLAMLDAAALSGRGGAGFPLANKIAALRPGGRPVVVVNGAEGEPASAKDGTLLRCTPHLVLDGAAVAAGAVGARRVLVAVTDPATAAVLRMSLNSRPDRSWFEVREVADTFIVGEARTLIEALNGAAALPPGRRVLPTDRGVGGQPTVLSNAETFAQLGLLARIGAREFSAVGTPTEPGTVLLTVSGAVAKPGVLEINYGTPLGALAAAVDAGPSQAVVVGGYHGTWLPADPAIELSRAGLAPFGATMGAGAVIFVGEHTCGLAELARVTRWLAEQSTRRCGPCAFGLPALAADVEAIAAGRADPAVAERHARLVTGRGACAHPDGAVRFVRSGLAVLADEVGTHRAYGGCRRSDAGHLSSPGGLE